MAKKKEGNIFDEKRWQAESDAEIMSRYQEIMSDKKRMNAAIKVARSRAEELSKRADAMSKVSSMGSGVKSRKK